MLCCVVLEMFTFLIKFLSFLNCIQHWNFDVTKWQKWEQLYAIMEVEQPVNLPHQLQNHNAGPQTTGRLVMVKKSSFYWVLVYPQKVISELKNAHSLNEANYKTTSLCSWWSWSCLLLVLLAPLPRAYRPQKYKLKALRWSRLWWNKILIFWYLKKDYVAKMSFIFIWKAPCSPLF